MGSGYRQTSQTDARGARNVGVPDFTKSAAPGAALHGGAAFERRRHELDRL